MPFIFISIGFLLFPIFLLPNIVEFLMAGKGKWNATKKNLHESINEGSLTKEAKVLFYFIASLIIPTKHLSTIREQEAFILYALLKGYKFDVGKIIESSIRCFLCSAAPPHRFVALSHRCCLDSSSTYLVSTISFRFILIVVGY